MASKCLAIVLLPKKQHPRSGAHDVNKVRKDGECGGAVISGNTNNDNDNNNTTTTQDCHHHHHHHHHHHDDATTTSAVSPVSGGKEILEDFKRQNKTCYWNPALIESIRQLEYLGFVEPCTVLVSGEDIHLENLRSAWGRRVLKAPINFTIDRIGESSVILESVVSLSLCQCAQFQMFARTVFGP